MSDRANTDQIMKDKFIQLKTLRMELSCSESIAWSDTGLVSILAASIIRVTSMKIYYLSLEGSERKRTEITAYEIVYSSPNKEHTLMSLTNPLGEGAGQPLVSAALFCLDFDSFAAAWEKAEDTCPNLDESWHSYRKWVMKSLYLILSDAGEEAIRKHIDNHLHKT